jgi:hypothetical protein
MRIIVCKAKRVIGRLKPSQAYERRPSALGIPYVVGSDGSRVEVIAKYRRRLWGSLGSRALPKSGSCGSCWPGSLLLKSWCCCADAIRWHDMLRGSA